MSERVKMMRSDMFDFCHFVGKMRKGHVFVNVCVFISIFPLVFVYSSLLSRGYLVLFIVFVYYLLFVFVYT